MHQQVEPVIKLEGVALTLPSRAGPVQILAGIDLAVGQGESLAVLGASGSGKTSLLMVMAGLERVSAGRVRVAGQDLTGLSEDRLARLRGQSIGIVFQSFHLVPTMTALENIALPLELAGRASAFREAGEALSAVGLERRASHFPAQLSGGERQRVAIARALVVNPAILLADEPTGNLDGRTGEEVMRLLFDLRRRQGATLVLVTHDPALARQCGRTIVMRDGQIAERVAT